MSEFVAQAIIRGKVIDTNLVTFGGRGENDYRFKSPDPHTFVSELPLGHPGKLADLYELSFEDILDYLEELGSRLDYRTNPHLGKALEESYKTAPSTPPIMRFFYDQLPKLFKREAVIEVAENNVGINYLEGWVPQTLSNGTKARIRAFGARTLHIVAGNAPAVSSMTIMRNAITRSDAIIKTPSNDPFTALAIVRTMLDMAPDHPLSKHISVAYWKGGDEAFEQQLYQPKNIEKIIAWGGFASVKHVTKYIQPGLELISLDPKNSASIIGAGTFDSETSLREAAQRLAADFGGYNQVGCVNARTVYVQSGTDDEGLKRIKKLGEYTYEALLKLPESFSTKPKEVNRELKSYVETARMQDDWYYVVGGENDEGAVIVSLLPEAVSFSTYLADRTVNLVPVDTLDEVMKVVTSYTQTVGIYPESLKKQLVNKLPLYGAQRLVSLGYACLTMNLTPQDGMEPLRRSVKWIVDEECSPEYVKPLWV